MAAVTNLVLADGQAPPVTHTFKPSDYDPKTKTFVYERQGSADPSGWWRLTLSVAKPSMAIKRQSSDERNVRVLVKVYLPKLETMGTNDAGITPAASVAWILRTTMEFVLPERATLQYRKDSRALLASMLADPFFQNVIDNVEAPF